MRLDIQPRLRIGAKVYVLGTLAAVCLSLLLGAMVLFQTGVDPWQAYQAIFSASLFGGLFALSDTCVKATPLLICGLGCSLAFRARLWNVGAEGQLLLGAWAATGIATYILPAGTPSFVMLLMMALGGMVAGGVWAGISGALRAWLNVNEIISSLMLVYIAKKLLNFFIFGMWSERGFPLTPIFPDHAWLPRLSSLAESYPSMSGLTAHLGIVVGLLCTILLWLVLSRTAWGFELRILGDSLRTAKYIGLEVKKRIFSTMVFSGAFAGLAGMIEVAGVVHRLQDRFSPDYGFVAIAVAWLGRLHPWGILLSAFLFAALLVGAKEVQPQGISMMLQGVIMLTMVGSDYFLRYRLRLLKVERGDSEARP